MGKNLKSLLNNYDKTSESDETSSEINEEKKILIKENINKIINETFNKEEYKKTLNTLKNLPKDFFDNPKNDSNFNLNFLLDEDKEKEKLKKLNNIENQREIDQLKIKERDENFNVEKEDYQKDIDNENENENEIDEDIIAMIECAEFLGNLTKNKKKKNYEILFQDKIKYNNNDNNDGDCILKFKKKLNKNIGKDFKFKLLGKKRNINGKEIYNHNKSNNSDNIEISDSDSIDFDDLINTDFRKS
jgi:hypothetical protein